MSIVYCSASNIIDNIHDTLPLDKFMYHITDKPALPYITFDPNALSSCFMVEILKVTFSWLRGGYFLHV